MDKLIGNPTGGLRLWMEASEVPGLLGDGAKGAFKSESLQIKHLFFRGTRLMYRNPEAASFPGRKPNPRGLPSRLSIERFWEALGSDVTERMRAFDWEAHEAFEALVSAERDKYLRCLRKTIGASFRSPNA